MHKRKSEPPETVPQDLINLLSVDQVATALHIGRSKVYDLIKYERLPHVNIGRIMVPVDSLQWWLKQREQGDGPRTNDPPQPRAALKGKKASAPGSTYQRREITRNESLGQERAK